MTTQATQNQGAHDPARQEAPVGSAPRRESSLIGVEEIDTWQRARRLSIRNARALLRWLALWRRRRPGSLPLFFVGPRAEIAIRRDVAVEIGPRLRIMSDFS